MEQIALSAKLREGTGKGVARKLRAAGQVPAVLYGAGNQPQPLTLDLLDLAKVLRKAGGENAFLALSINEGPARMAVLHEMQHDYLGKKVVHVDLMEVKAGQALTMEVPLEFVGSAPGVSQGGVLNLAYHSVRLEGQISELPEVVRVDLSG
ncbi:MAG: 50S ribosomal protein L25, partial [Desulfarculus sp.]|nr:50S ribosomal protein L25 [Desulfarculus sp.]